MAEFHFDNKIYFGRQYVSGDVERTFTDADVDNLTKGGSGHGAMACPGDCASIRAGNATKETNEGTSPAVDVEIPSGAGPDGPADRPADPPAEVQHPEREGASGVGSSKRGRGRRK